MIRAAKSGDAPAIEAFLQGYAETSMFLRSNLAQFGMDNRDHPTATKYFLEETAGISAVFGISNAGFILVQAPNASAGFWQGFRQALVGRDVAGVTGDAVQVVQVKRALDLQQAVFALDRPEPLYRLSLDALPAPVSVDIRKPTKADLPLLREWMYDYYIEALGAAKGSATRERVIGEARRAMQAGNTRLLIQNGQPVAKTAFNASLPDLVQIGGVYTPPAARNQGLARRAVAAHLHEVRGQGVKTAILFASGAAACRAYEAIGFKQVGTYALAILSTPVLMEASQ